MDFNIDNYSNEEICKLFNLDFNNLTSELLKDKFFEKREKLNDSDNPEIQREKITILNFYTNAYFKLNTYLDKKSVNNIDSINKNLENINNILINNNILNKNLNKNDIGQSPHYVIQEPKEYTINTYSKNIRNGTVNPIYRQTIQKFLNINTRFRDNYVNTQSNKFNINLPSALNKVISMQVVNFNIPGVVYVISEIYQNNIFRIKMEDLDNVDTNFVDIKIEYGSYDIESLIEAINKKLSEEAITNVRIDFNPLTGKVNFKSTNGENFIIDFFFTDRKNCINNVVENNISSFQLTLGWLLGFRGPFIIENFNSLNKELNKQLVTCTVENEYIQDKKVTTTKKELKKRNPNIQYNSHNSNFDGLPIFYQGKNSYTSEGIYDPYFNRYFLLSINDYMNNHNEIFVSPFKNTNLGNSNIIARVSSIIGTTTNSVDQDNNDSNIFPKRVYFGPTEINKIEVRLFDEYGKLVDINNADYSFILKFDLLYEN